MKKRWLIVVLIFMLNLSVNAQVFRRFSAGVYSGSQVFGKIDSDAKLSKMSGFTAGVDLRYSFSKQPEGFSLHFLPGFNSFRQLMKTGGIDTPFYSKTTWRWGAVHLPLLLRYTFSSGKVRPFAELGPMLRLRQALDARIVSGGCGIAGCFERESSLDLQALTTEDAIGLTAGAGIEVDLWKVTVPISVRIQEAFGTYETNVVFYESPGYQNLKTRTIQLTAGVNF